MDAICSGPSGEAKMSAYSFICELVMRSSSLQIPSFYIGIRWARLKA
jgi:hypothetical protein